jgi:hypothetical protein
MSGSEDARTADGGLARPWAPLALRRVATVLGLAYLLAVWLDATGLRGTERLLPPFLRFFVQVAELFPRAADYVIEWRVRGYRCDLARFEEMDVRPFFSIRRDDKENRFDRTMFFYRREPRVLAALDDFLTAPSRGLGFQPPIGGVMLLSLRVPIPSLGSADPGYERLPIDRYPRSVERKVWYLTPIEVRDQRCAGRR